MLFTARNRYPRLDELYQSIKDDGEYAPFSFKVGSFKRSANQLAITLFSQQVPETVIFTAILSHILFSVLENVGADVEKIRAEVEEVVDGPLTGHLFENAESIEINVDHSVLHLIVGHLLQHHVSSAASMIAIDVVDAVYASFETNSKDEIEMMVGKLRALIDVIHTQKNEAHCGQSQVL